MDDTLAMQDRNERVQSNGPITKEGVACGDGGSASLASVAEDQPPPLVEQHQQLELLQQHDQQLQQLQQLEQHQQLLQPHPAADLLAGANRPAISPRSPQSGGQQQVLDASSTTSDGSQELLGAGKQHGPPRRTYSSVDVDAAKQAAMSALAGLDMTTTKANLDASKAAAATARANGEVPTHVRKSNLRSVSCRQLGTGSSGAAAAAAAGVSIGKTVAFDESATAGSKPRPADAGSAGAGKTVQWRAGTTGGDGSQARRTMRAPASRCISLPHVLQGRAGMANRLAATYAQDAALQQQLHLLNGATPGPQVYGTGLVQVGQPAMGQVDVLSMYQLQQAAANTGVDGGQLLGQRSFGANAALSTVDDSMLQLRSTGGLVMPGQQLQHQAAQVQQQQAQVAAAQLGKNWQAAGAAGQQQHVAWAPGPGRVPVSAGGNAPGLANSQLLAQLQAGGQGAMGASSGNEVLWQMQAASASGGMQQVVAGAGQPQGLLVTPGNAGLPNMQASGGLLSPHMQLGTPSLAGGGGPAAINSINSSMFATLLEQYQQVSWTALAAAQSEASIREQLLTELVLQLTMLHTLGGVLQSTLAPSDALNDFSYLGSAARRHIATFSRLSQAGDIAVQMLAMIAPLACRHLGTTDVLEAAFLVLDTLALANRDVGAVVAQQRLEALSHIGWQLPVELLLQQQTLCLSYINSMAAAVTPNKQLLESMGAAGSDAALSAQPGVQVSSASGVMMQAAAHSGSSVLPVGGLPLAVSRPMMLSPTAAGGTPSLSPSSKTPLATYFEDNPGAGLISPAGMAAASAPVPPGVGAGMGSLGGLPAGCQGGLQADASMLTDGLAAMGLAARQQPGGAADPSGTATINSLAGLHHMGMVPGQVQAVAAAASGPSGGMTLFGHTGLLGGADGSMPASGPSSGQRGVSAGIVGV